MRTALADFYSGRRVLITGHTGFKGAWLSIWLKRLGASVAGLALPPEPDRPSLYDAAELGTHIRSHLGDLRDFDAVHRTMSDEAPEVVFHLAAQSLVRRSYRQPLDTWSTNLMGTAHLLEAIRHQPSVRAVVVVTSDKCYHNREWPYAYRENDPLGGADPYSASKGAQEILTASWRSSFFAGDGDSPPVGIATGRAGNVLGGGDWAEDRLVPDLVNALAAGESALIRNPRAVRPWQHVLEPLSGYLSLGARLFEEPERFAEGWNFGPEAAGSASVGAVADRVVRAWGSGAWHTPSAANPSEPHEAHLLRLDCTKAIGHLGWRPVYDIGETVDETVSWYRSWASSRSFDAQAVTLGQIERYEGCAREKGATWALPGDSLTSDGVSRA